MNVFKELGLPVIRDEIAFAKSKPKKQGIYKLTKKK